MNFPEIGPAHASKIEISEKYWMSFPENRLCHTGDLHPGKLKTRKNFWMSFPGFARREK